MLSHLNIQGLAIIDFLSIDFTRGFNVITGETGAGKSILIKALGLLLGAKASVETVRRGREAAIVTGTFELPEHHRSLSILASHAMPIERDGNLAQVIIRRSVTAKGRSLAWINDVPVTSQVLREFAVSLIDVFGQHDNLRLLDPSQHLGYVDQFLANRTLRSEYAAAWQKSADELSALTHLVQDAAQKRRDADYLAYRCEELKQFEPTPDDFAATDLLCRRASHLMSFSTTLQRAQVCLDQGAGGEALSRPLWEAAKTLGRLAELDPALKSLGEEANVLAARLDELSFQVGKAATGFEVNEDDVEAAQARLAAYQELFRKFAVDGIDRLLQERDRLTQDLDSIASAATEVRERLTRLLSHAATAEQIAAKLTKARRIARTAIKSKIEQELRDLAMAGAAIDVEFTVVARANSCLDFSVFGQDCQELWAKAAQILAALTDEGAERAQLLLAANQGEAMLPLHKVASGGEASRLMLAFKKALAAGGDTCILVFDEIDSGISGRVADVVGRKMHDLSSAFQIICISHLAQVAAYASKHFRVSKTGKGDRTEAALVPLTAADAEQEIARLLSGDEITASSRANARALIRKAQGSAPAQGADHYYVKSARTKGPPQNAVLWGREKA